MVIMRRLLIVDIGNTAVKMSVYSGDCVEFSERREGEPSEILASRWPDYYNLTGVAWCSVRKDNEAVRGFLASLQCPVVELTPETPVPLTICYDRNVLGADRLAAAVGAQDADNAVLSVDAGTALTVDLVADGCFKGGNISPGLSMRFRALNRFTSRLPLVDVSGDLPDFGHDTSTAIRAGVVNGLLAEIKNDFECAQKKYHNLRLILTGGDAATLAPGLLQLGLRPEVDEECVMRGLMRIFMYNNPEK